MGHYLDRKIFEAAVVLCLKAVWESEEGGHERTTHTMETALLSPAAQEVMIYPDMFCTV